MGKKSRGGYANQAEGKYDNSYLSEELRDRAMWQDKRIAAEEAFQKRWDSLTPDQQQKENEENEKESKMRQAASVIEASERQKTRVYDIDKKVVERYMSKNYEKVKDINALKPGQVYYIIKKQKDDGIRKPFRYECKKNAQECKSEICLNKPEEEDCVLWKKTTWGSLTGESAEKYKPYTFDKYIEYIGDRLIDDNGNHRSDGYFAKDIRINNGRIIDPRGGGKSKRKTKRKGKQSRRKGKGSKKCKTRRHSKK